MLTKTGTDTLRAHNRALVLATLRRLGPVSHTEISQWSGLSSATVSAITNELELKKILQRKETVPLKGKGQGRGRPRVLFAQRPNYAYIAIARIAGEKIEYSLVNYAGTLKDRFDIPRTDDNIEIFCAEFKAGLSQLLQRSQIGQRDIQIVSITSKGHVQRGRAVLLWSSVFGESKIDFKELLGETWQAKIILTNETRYSASAIAENHADKKSSQLASQLPGKFAVLSLGHSIGLGVAERDGVGRVTSFAPTFGHMVHKRDGPQCVCNSKGCIESFAGFSGILRTAYGVDDNTIPANFVPLEEMDKLGSRARGGDAMAQYAFRQAGEVLGIGISRLFNILGTMPISITGSGMRYFDLMHDEFVENLKSNLQIRFEELPQINMIEEEPILIFNGNVQTMLSQLDAKILTGPKLGFVGNVLGVSGEY